MFLSILLPLLNCLFILGGKIEKLFGTGIFDQQLTRTVFDQKQQNHVNITATSAQMQAKQSRRRKITQRMYKKQRNRKRNQHHGKNGQGRGNRKQNRTAIYINMRNTSKGTAPDYTKSQLFARQTLIQQTVHQLVQNGI